MAHNADFVEANDDGKSDSWSGGSLGTSLESDGYYFGLRGRYSIAPRWALRSEFTQNTIDDEDAAIAIDASALCRALGDRFAIRRGFTPMPLSVDA